MKRLADAMNMTTSTWGGEGIPISRKSCSRVTKNLHWRSMWTFGWDITSSIYSTLWFIYIFAMSPCDGRGRQGDLRDCYLLLFLFPFIILFL